MRHPKRRVVFIASSPHSGSTLLELLLCSHSKCVGLGESYQLVDPDNPMIHRLDNQWCSCGVLIEACDFWGHTIQELRRQSGAGAREHYELFMRRFDETYADERVLVDSSKAVAALALLSEIPNLDLRVLHLVKDVRAWTVSMQDNYRRNVDYAFSALLKKRGLKGLYRYFRRNKFYGFHDWYFTQKKIDHFVRHAQISSFHVGYEQLCLNPEAKIKEVCQFLELDYEEAMLSTIHSHSHNVFGNRMRFQADKRDRISYDNRWFYKNDWLLPSILFPYVMSYNKSRVYEQPGSMVWDQ